MRVIIYKSVDLGVKLDTDDELNWFDLPFDDFWVNKSCVEMSWLLSRFLIRCILQFLQNIWSSKGKQPPAFSALEDNETPQSYFFFKKI